MPSSNKFGFLLVDKPYGMSSAHVVAKVRRRFKVKVGHTGTLDPMATGMLVLAIGEATKFSQYSMQADKHYTAGITLGYETDSCDKQGHILRFGPSLFCDTTSVALILEKYFLGSIEQYPPKVSALKYQGKPYYYYARKGIDIPIAKRSVTIHQYENLCVNHPNIEVDILCSSGTYIRAIARDLGSKFQSYAYLSMLRRNYIHPWTAAQMHSLEYVLSADSLKDLMQPIDAVLSHYPSIEINNLQLDALRQGKFLSLTLDAKHGIVKVYAKDTFYGLVQVYADKLYKPLKIITQDY